MDVVFIIEDRAFPSTCRAMKCNDLKEGHLSAFHLTEILTRFHLHFLAHTYLESYLNRPSVAKQLCSASALSRLGDNVGRCRPYNSCL